MRNYMRTGRTVRLLVLMLIAVASLCASVVIATRYQTEENIIAPVLSKDSGFYRNDFYLRMDSSAGATIYYTLDGSQPDEHSLVYSEPILIDDATGHENVYSMRTDTSAGFLTDLIERYKTLDSPPGYVPPDYLVDKCTIIRAIAVSEHGKSSGETAATYFVGLDPAKYGGCGIVSIITDPSNLFDPHKGIYVTGEVFEDYLSIGQIDNYWRFWPANYREHGKQWEREAVFHFFDEMGGFSLSKAGGIRSRGGVSRGTIPRSLNLYAREEYDGNERFDAAFFGNDYNPKGIILASGGNQLITVINDYLMVEQTSGLNFASLACKPYVMFLDGEYWGFYWLTEKIDTAFVSYHYDVEEDNVVIIKNNQLEAGEQKDLSLYERMRGYIIESDMSREENFETACELFDLDSLLDYYAAQIYIARSEDWPSSNTALWRTREVKEEPYADGKWRWILFDSNSSSMNANLSAIRLDTLDYVLESDRMFASLWENETFRDKFKKRILEIADQCFLPNDITALIQNYSDRMIPILSQSWRRFYGSSNDKRNEYNDKVNAINDFFATRKQTVEAWFADAGDGA